MCKRSRFEQEVYNDAKYPQFRYLNGIQYRVYIGGLINFDI